MKTDYAAHDPCWIHVDGTLVQGVVVSSFSCPWHVMPYYIIQVRDPEWLHFEVRDAYLMTHDPEVPPAYQRERVRAKLPSSNMIPIRNQ